MLLLASGCPQFSSNPVPTNSDASVDSGRRLDAAPTIDGARMDARNDTNAVADATTETTTEGGVAPRTAVDLLFVVDNSGSMGPKLDRVRTHIAAFVAMLRSGNLSGGAQVDRDFRHVDSVQVGVVVTDMGVGGAQIGSAGGCATSNTIRNGELNGGVFAFPPSTATDVVNRGLDVGIMGCGIERPLDAMLRAISPATAQSWTAPNYVAPRFAGANGTQEPGLAGPGAPNSGFVREGSILVALIISDEDDSSLESSVNATQYFSYPTGSTGLHPGVRASIEGFHEGTSPRAAGAIARDLTALRVHPAHVIFGALIGAPVQTSYADLTALQSAPSMRPRIFVTAGSSCPASSDDCSECPRGLEAYCATRNSNTELVPVCATENVPMNNSALAAPGYRAVRVAREVELLGASAVVGSICAADYQDFFRRVATAVGRLTS